MIRTTIFVTVFAASWFLITSPLTASPVSPGTTELELGIDAMTATTRTAIEPHEEMLLARCRHRSRTYGYYRGPNPYYRSYYPRGNYYFGPGFSPGFGPGYYSRGAHGPRFYIGFGF